MIRVILLVAAYIIEARAFVAFTKDEGALFSISHLLSTASVLLLTHTFWLEGRQKNLSLLASSLWGCFPFFGALLGPVLALALKLRELRATSAVVDIREAWEIDDEQARKLALDLMHYRRSSKHDDRLAKLTQEPLSDVLRTGDIVAKKKILSWLRFVREPWGVRLLKMCQKDREYEMRYLASRALSAIEQEWYDEIRSLDRRVDAEPDRIELREEIVALYLSFYASGVLSRRIGKILLKRALSHVKQGLALATGNAKLHTFMGDLSVAVSEPEAALQAYERALELNPGAKDLRGKRAEALYYLNRFEEVQGVCQTIADSVPMSPGDECVRYWREPGERAA